MDVSQYIPMELWGKDHWSTLAYIETVMVDSVGFQCGMDARMRSNRRNFRVMYQQCPKPKRMGGRCGIGVAMDAEKHGSRLSDGTTVSNHDDWCCLQDAQEAGFFVDGNEVEPARFLLFSDKGKQAMAALRIHKAAGGTFGNFVFPPCNPIPQSV